MSAALLTGSSKDIIASSFTIKDKTHGGNVDMVGGSISNAHNIVMVDHASTIDMRGGTVMNARFNVASIMSMIQSTGCIGVPLVTSTGKIRTILGGHGLQVTESMDGQVRIDVTGTSPYLVTNVNYDTLPLNNGVIPIGSGNNTLTPSKITIENTNVMNNVKGINFVDNKGVLDMKGGIITNVDYTTIEYFVQSTKAPGVPLVTSWYCSPPGRIRTLVPGVNITLVPLGDESVQINSSYSDPGPKFMINTNYDTKPFSTGSIAIGSGISGNDLCASSIKVSNGNNLVNVQSITMNQGGTIDMNGSSFINLSTSSICEIVQSTNVYGGASLVTKQGKIKTLVAGPNVMLTTTSNEDKIQVDVNMNSARTVPQFPRYIWMGGFSSYTGPGVNWNSNGELISKPMIGVPDMVVYKLTGIQVPSSMSMWIYMRISGNGNTSDCYVTVKLNNVIIKPSNSSQFCDYSSYPNGGVTRGMISGFTGDIDNLTITFNSSTGTRTFIGYDIQIIPC